MGWEGFRRGLFIVPSAIHMKFKKKLDQRFSEYVLDKMCFQCMEVAFTLELFGLLLIPHVLQFNTSEHLQVKNTPQLNNRG
jgi:hypothetical protein